MEKDELAANEVISAHIAAIDDALDSGSDSREDTIENLADNAAASARALGLNADQANGCRWAVLAHFEELV